MFKIVLNVQECDATDDQLMKKCWVQNTKSKIVKVFFDYLPQEDHATIMHQAVFNALRLLYPVKK